MVSQILNGDSFFYVTVDIVDAFNDRFGQNKAKSNFETAIKERYPEIQEVNWAE